MKLIKRQTRHSDKCDFGNACKTEAEGAPGITIRHNADYVDTAVRVEIGRDFFLAMSKAEAASLAESLRKASI